MLLVGTGVVTVIPLLCFGGAATRIPLSTLGLMQYVTPTVQFLLGILFFHEPMPAMRWVGFSLIWLALVLFTDRVAALAPPAPAGPAGGEGRGVGRPRRTYPGEVSDVEPVSVVAPPLRGPVMMNQDWRDLTMVHWAVDPERVRHLVPPGVRPDVLDGATYVGLVPFRMVGAGLARGPGVPWAGSFLETNVRLYSVDATGRRGIVFLSLDTDRAVVVAGARAAFGLPYRWARMRHAVDGDVHTYDARLRRPWSRATSRVVVRAGAPRERTRLDDFLSARWGLHVRWWGRTLYVPNAPPAVAAARRRAAAPRRRAAGLGRARRPGAARARPRRVQRRRAHRVRAAGDAARPRR